MYEKLFNEWVAETQIMLELDEVEARNVFGSAVALVKAHWELQSRVKPWLEDCFGHEIATDKKERNHRFIEEAIELVQSTGCSKEDVCKLVEYVYNRPVGEPKQEVGGVMITLAALCLANDMNMHTEAETELMRIWLNKEKIRQKQKAKPKF